MISRTFQIRYQTFAKIILTLSIFSFFGGIFCVYFSPIFWCLFLCILLLGFFLSFFLKNKYQKLWWIILFFILSFLLWCWVLYNNIRTTHNEMNKALLFIGKSQKVELLVLRFEGSTESKNRMIGEIRQINNIPNSQRILIQIAVDKNISPKPGDILSTIVKVESPKNTEEFRYKEFLQAKHIYLTANIDVFELIWKDKSFISSFFVREMIYTKFRSLYPSEHAWLLAAMIFWDKQWITKEYQTLYQETWISHILVVSGSNITLVLILFASLFWFFPRYIRIFTTLLALFIFVWIVWGGVPVIRAAIMWIIWYLSTQGNQKIDPLILLLCVAVGFGIYMPHEIITDASFYLSFLATFGMILFVPFLQKWFFFIPNSFIGLRDTLATTLAATWATLVVLLLLFWQFSLYWPIVNLFIGPIIGPITLWGIFSLLITFISQTWWIIFAWWVDLWLNILLFIAQSAHSLPWNLQDITLSIYEHYIIGLFCFFLFLFISIFSIINKGIVSIQLLKREK